MKHPQEWSRAETETDFEAMVDVEIAIAQKWNQDEAAEFLDLMTERPGRMVPSLAFFMSSRSGEGLDALEQPPETLMRVGIYWVLFAVFQKENMELRVGLRASEEEFARRGLTTAFKDWARAIRFLAKVIDDEGGAA